MTQGLKRIILFFAVSLAIGMMISIVARNTSGAYLFVSGKSLQDYKVSIAAEKESVKKLRLLTAENNLRLAQFQASLYDPQDQSLEETLAKELALAKMAAGAVDVTGPGVIIKLDDGVRPLYSGEDPNNVIVHDMDLLSIVNELNLSGAEALSINGQRITSTSELSCSGYSVRVNDIFIARPFIIKAIGDPKTLKAGLLAPYQVGDLLLAWGLIFEVEEAETLTIEANPHTTNYQYLKLVKEGDI